MQRACIAIVDAAHARIYAFDTDGHPVLHPLRELTRPDRQDRNGFGSRDHRTDHLAELDDRFAKVIASEVDRLVTAHDFEHVLLIASPKMLGTLRNHGGPLRRGPVAVDEIAQNLSWMTLAQLHDHLAAMHLIQPRERLSQERAAITLR